MYLIIKTLYPVLSPSHTITVIKVTQLRPFLRHAISRRYKKEPLTFNKPVRTFVLKHKWLLHTYSFKYLQVYITVSSKAIVSKFESLGYDSLQKYQYCSFTSIINLLGHYHAALLLIKNSYSRMMVREVTFILKNLKKWAFANSNSLTGSRKKFVIIDQTCPTFWCNTEGLTLTNALKYATFIARLRIIVRHSTKHALVLF